MLPQDPYILFSFVNTELRDRFDSLEALCEDYRLEREELVRTLAAAGFRYDREQKRFR